MRVITHTVSKARAAEIDRILDANEQVTDSKQDALLMSETIDLGGGYELDQKLCNGDTPWVDTVLFLNGSEVTVYEPGEDFFTDVEIPELDARIEIVRQV